MSYDIKILLSPPFAWDHYLHAYLMHDWISVCYKGISRENLCDAEDSLLTYHLTISFNSLIIFSISVWLLPSANTVVSLAYRKMQKRWTVATCKSVTQIRNNRGPGIDPWMGTPNEVYGVEMARQYLRIGAILESMVLCYYGQPIGSTIECIFPDKFVPPQQQTIPWDTTGNWKSAGIQPIIRRCHALHMVRCHVISVPYTSLGIPHWQYMKYKMKSNYLLQCFKSFWFS